MLSKCHSAAFRALSGRLKFTVRRHEMNKDSLSAAGFVERLRRETRPLEHAQEHVTLSVLAVKVKPNERVLY